MTRKEYWVGRGGELVAQCASRAYAEEVRQKAQAELESEGLSQSSLDANRATIREVSVSVIDHDDWLNTKAARDVELYLAESLRN